MGFIEYFGGREACLHRTERALRVVVFGALACWLSVSTDSSMFPTLTKLPLRFLIGFIYVCLAVLMPPFLLAIPMISSLLFLGLLMGLAITTALLVIAEYSTGLVYFLFLLLCPWCFSLRTGRAASFTNVGILLMLYVLTLTFFEVYPYMKDGTYVALPMSAVKELVFASNTTDYRLLLESVQNMMLLPILTFIDVERPSIAYAIQHNLTQSWAWTIEYPGGIPTSADLSPILGNTLYATLTPVGMSVGLDGGSWLIEVMWSNYGGSLSELQACLVNVSLGIAILALSIVCPPQRRMGTLVTRKLLGDAFALLRKAYAADPEGAQATSVPGVAMLRMAHAVSTGSKHVLMAALEPYYLYPGPASGWFRPLEATRKALGDALWAAKHELCDGDAGVPPRMDATSRERRTWICAVCKELEALARLEPSILHRRAYLDAKEKGLSALAALAKDAPQGTETDPAVSALTQACGCMAAYYAELHTQSLKGLLITIVICLTPGIALVKRLASTLVAPVVVLFQPAQWRGPHAFWRAPEVQYLAKVLVGWAVIVGLPLFSKAYRSWSIGVPNEEVSSASDMIEEASTTKITSWVMLGYLTTFFVSYEGTVHRASFRVVGTLIGAFSGWCILKIVYGPDHPALVILWCLVVIFIDVWLCANPTRPLLGWHPELVYGAQVLTYTQLYITLSDITGEGSRDYLVVSRILGNLFGMCLGIILAHSWPRISADMHTRRFLSEVFRDATSLLPHLDGSPAQTEEEITKMLESIDELEARAQRLHDEGAMRRWSFFGRTDPRVGVVFALVHEYVGVVSTHALGKGRCISPLVPATPELYEFLGATADLIACPALGLVARFRSGRRFDRTATETPAFLEASARWKALYDVVARSTLQAERGDKDAGSSAGPLVPARPLIRIALAVHTELATKGVYNDDQAFKVVASAYMDKSARESAHVTSTAGASSAMLPTTATGSGPGLVSGEVEHDNDKMTSV